MSDKPSLIDTAISLFKIYFFIITAGVIIYLSTGGLHVFRVEGTGLRVHDLSYAVVDFKKKYHAFPGDMKDAAKLIPGCDETCTPPASGAGNGKIGSADFAKSLRPLTAAVSDETELFWKHLRLAGLYDGGMTHNSPLILPNIHYVVGYADGSKFSAEIAPENERMKGNIIVLVSDDVFQGNAKMNEAGKQPLTPSEAAGIDRKMDDGRANTGWVQGYGTPKCFEMEHPDTGRFKDLKSYDYNERTQTRDCGLIFLIAADDDYKPKEKQWQIDLKKSEEIKK